MWALHGQDPCKGPSNAAHPGPLPQTPQLCGPQWPQPEPQLPWKSGTTQPTLLSGKALSQESRVIMCPEGSLKVPQLTPALWEARRGNSAGAGRTSLLVPSGFPAEEVLATLGLAGPLGTQEHRGAVLEPLGYTLGQGILWGYFGSHFPEALLMEGHWLKLLLSDPGALEHSPSSHSWVSYLPRQPAGGHNWASGAPFVAVCPPGNQT